MTNDTRGAILDAIRDRKSHLHPQELMDEYLTGYPTREGYESIAAGLPEFYAVLATEEYHAHWERKGVSGYMRGGRFHAVEFLNDQIGEIKS